MKLKVGEMAPDFELPDENGEIHSLSDYKNDWVLIYFYPKDDTPGCTKEACMIRDNFPKFEELELKVLGISTDSEESHSRFKDKYSLPFTLLADTKKEVTQKYEVAIEKKIFGKTFHATARTSFLLDPEGRIAKIYKKANPTTHAGEVLQDLSEMKD